MLERTASLTTSHTCNVFTEPYNDSDNAQVADFYDGLSITHKSQTELFPTTSLPVTETYELVTGIQAGKSSISLTRDPDTENGSINTIHHPFLSSCDYSFALWLRSSGVSKGSVDRLLKNRQCGPLLQHLSFRNGREWHEKLESLSLGVQPLWYKVTFSIEPEYVGQSIQTYELLHQDILEAVRFLLGHQPFLECLSYAPVRNYNDEGARIYSEMHTAEWW